MAGGVDDAGVGHHDVQATELGHTLVDECRHDVEVADVAADRRDPHFGHLDPPRRNPVARAVEGMAEGWWVVAVQWHPENLAANQPEHLAPFKLLVEKAAEAKKA